MDHCEREKRKTNPKQTANIFSKLTFAYTWGLFKKGYINSDLEDADLYEVMKQCNSKRCGDRIEKQWILEYKKDESPSIVRLLWARFGYSVLEPYAVSNLVSYFKPGQTKMTKYDAYYFGGLVMGLNVLHCFYIHNYIITVQELGIEIKTAFSSLIYRKALKLTPSALSEISLGNIVTLITKDVHCFFLAIWMINDTWIGIVQTCTICYLLYAKIGSVAFIGIAVLFSVIPLQIYIGKHVSQLRLRVGKKTDQRLQITQETLSTIKIIKMYTWERYFDQKVTAARIEEINKMLIAFYLKVMLVIMGILCSRLGFYVLVMSYIWMGYTTNTELVFYILSVFKDLRQTLGVIIPFGVGRAAELYSAVTRISKVITAEELPPKKGTDEPTLKPLIELKDAVVHIKKNRILKDITFRTDSGLTIVTGTVGSGKSSLLKTILQDYPLTSGHLVTHGRISYASQDPWLFPSSIRQNILFGETYDEKRYQEVVRVCALEYDFSLFDKRDETIVSDRGLNLSKGQQARVNLARAIYKESEIYLLDDSLTALDGHVQDYIFNECIKKYLKDKICILVSQTANHIQEADNVVIMDKSEIKEVGKPDEKIIADVNELVCKDDDLEKEVVEKADEENIDDEKGETTKLLETEQTTRQKVYGEVNKKGEVDFAVYKKYMKFGGGFIFMALNVFLFGGTQFVESYSDKLITKWVDLQQKVIDLEATAVTGNSTSYTFDQLNGTMTTINDTNHYMDQLNNTMKTITYTTQYIDQLNSTMETVTDINQYTDQLNSTMEAIDLNNIDEHLPFIFSECFRVAFSVSGIVLLMATVNWKFLFPSVIFFCILVIMRRFYLPTGRSLKRLEAATRSPMVGHLNASLEGLTTIRAYKAQNILIEEFDRHQDLFTSANHALACTTRAFGFMMDGLCSILIGLVVARFLFIDTGTSAGNVGLAITQVFMLAGHVQWGVRNWAELENLMTSVERLLEYTEVKQEPAGGASLENWPTEGAVTYENVTLTYSNNEKVLKNLNFTVDPKQKIGIVGRTGAGKSSIISSLFRLYEVEGRIIIDGVDIKTLSLKFLRKKIAIIPQDPVLFTGTIRTNVDPFNEFTDEEIWKVLDKLHLKDLMKTLDFEITDSGATFSSGQKQLMCLARALIRKTKIVVLDEATANMDHETDALLHDTIKENFSNCTVFTIAHRLHSILECDKVMVLDRGEIREFDDPVSLMENKDGIFYKMVEQAGLLNYLRNCWILVETALEKLNMERNQKHPRESSNVLSTIFFCWTIPIFKRGLHKELDEDDLYGPLKEHSSHELGDKLESIWKQETNRDSPSLTRSIWRVFGCKICCYGVILFMIEFGAKKSLKLSKSALAKTNSGKVINLMANDLGRFDNIFLSFHNIWAAPIQIILVMCLLYVMMGAYALTGIIFFVLSIPVQMTLGKKTSKYRLKTAVRTDERLQLINELINGIKVIKMYIWEKAFVATVDKARKLEMKQIKSTSMVRAINASMSMFLNRTALYFAVLAYVLAGNTPQAYYIFVVSSFYNVLRQPLVFHIPHAISTLAEASVSIKRLEEFLTLEEVRTSPNRVKEDERTKGIFLNEVSVRWGSSSENILSDIHFSARNKELVAIVGPVGSGKSTILQIILKELPVTKGTVDVSGTISYASQEPWLFTGSIRDNILFGQAMNLKRYQEVCRVCALETDFSLLPNGDGTLVGDRGATLSGGQKARINLARAVYKDVDIYLLDDPLSAVDMHVGEELYRNCISGFLKEKCVVLVTHQHQYLTNADRIYSVTENGGMEISSSTFEYKDSNHPINCNPKDISGENTVTTLPLSKDKAAVKESKESGAIQNKVYTEYIKSGASSTDYFLAYCNLFTKMLKSVVNTNMSFFYINPSGRILNRFSKDIGLIDEVLPVTILDAFQVLFNVISITALVAIVNPWMLIPTFVIFVIFYWIKKIYLASSQNLKRIEASARSPVYSHLADSIQGLTTVRALDAQEYLTHEFNTKQNMHSSAFYLFMACNKTFGFWLDFQCVIYVSVVIMTLLLTLDETAGGNVGLAITQSLALTGVLQWGIKQWSEMETQTTAVERVVEYAELQPEKDVNNIITIDSNWPSAGCVHFENVSLRYSLDNPLVLDSITVRIAAKEKIGIVGRTGAGKSSIVAALFRLVKTKGTILIDGINTKTIPLNVLRSKISIIPQEPILLQGSLRRNLDPFDEYKDDQLWAALKEVGLENAIQELPGGMFSRVYEGGVNFSVGQKQLLCIARALLRNNKILVLDEATSSVDQETDRLIQNLLRRKFNDCTVLTIAHRLRTVMDSDKVIVMDNGSIVEFDHPYNLLQNTNSKLFTLLSRTENSEFQESMKIAAENYTKRRDSGTENKTNNL
ncbi:hypothetical protein NQ315_004862 [Exocentrus adspersus]|uniref:Multidrug resistance-associated protein lethal(2)03659 n=1 Tax=Exocentrus adspersus TaxID=1586481 RepID=A0AAV8W239_9CUCU|nr:hypothetical protein NQ315_004862 [Exocentrus adspersus]